jgi:hypothetical protein
MFAPKVTQVRPYLVDRTASQPAGKAISALDSTTTKPAGSASSSDDQPSNA